MGVAFACSLLGPLASACVYDLRERRIPNKLVAGMALLWCALCLISGSVDTTVRGLIGATVLGGGSLLLANAFERITGHSSFGGGDIKLLAVLGLYLGLCDGLTCLLAACIAALLLAAIIPHTRFANAPGSTPGSIPFAPALFIGVVACFVL